MNPRMPTLSEEHIKGSSLSILQLLLSSQAQHPPHIHQLLKLYSTENVLSSPFTSVSLPVQMLAGFQTCVVAYRHLTPSPFSPLQCLCLAPTYELALQTGRVVEQMGKFCVDVQVMYAVRGNPSMCQ